MQTTIPLIIADAQPPDMTIQYEPVFYKTMALVAIFIAMIFIGIWLFRKFTSTRIQQLNDVRSIKIIEKRPISPKTVLYLVEVNGRQTMISESQMDVRPIADTTPSEEEPPLV